MSDFTSKAEIKKSFAFMKKHGKMEPIPRTRMNTPFMTFYVTHDGHCPQGIQHHIIDGDWDFTIICGANCVSKLYYDKLTEEDC